MYVYAAHTLVLPPHQVIFVDADLLRRLKHPPPHPPPLHQVIFVDADQIVREDMGKLYDMDLKGRPLAYTPMCDNNVEMEGYRFWKTVSAAR